ncbi:28S ribosomal protein S36, mitochondrial-like [Haliotis rubra]|uniref:28S ribosomal protein S36, mitochondrial-like n=1 Tax=Haliotis rubra TaxID=36100 RepID=UPI001EE51D5B|nr:28S ribosomal protein S36, mitochondrial-like [Haliotis rubra]
MAASAARTVLMTIKPHVPLIKFPSRILPSGAAAAAASPPATASSPARPPADSKPIGRGARGSGLEYSDLPLKYHRKVISLDEMEYIEKGGQV